MNTKRITALCLAGVLTVSVLTGCGINKNAAAATFADGTTVSLGVANFIMRYQQASVDELYRQILGDDVWSQDLYGTGSTMADDVKDSVMDTLHEMYTLKSHMADYGVALTDEETKAISDAASTFMEANSSETLKELGATQDIVEEMLYLYTIESKMQAAIKETADTEVSDEEANMRAYTMLSFSTSGSYDEDYNYVELTDEEVLEVQQEAESVYAEITDPADLESVAEAHDMSATTGTYAADNTSLADEVKTALDALKEGEMSELISTDSGYYIVRLDAETDEEATESNRESIIEDRQDELYDEVLSGWQEDDGWTVKTKQIAKIEFKNTFSSPEEESTETETEDTEAVDTESTEAEGAEAADTENTEAEDTEAVDTESTEAAE
jgi:foldase protein PrsA